MKTKLDLVAISVLTLVTLAAGHKAMAQTTISQESVIRGVGFPLVLSVPGSYKLVSNIEAGSGSPAIEITAPGVTLDLNGFTVSSPGTCTHDVSTYSVICHNAANSEVGIRSTVGGAVIRNGNVRGFHIGVWFYQGDHLERLHVSHNHTGVRSLGGLGARTLIRDVRAELNRDNGFDIDDAQIHGSTAARNGASGFNLNRSVIHESSAYFNKNFGITGNTHTAASRSDAFGNLWENINTGSVKSMGGNRNGEVSY